MWYLAETPVHAVSESLQGFRGRDFSDAMLLRFGRPLAIVGIELPDDVADDIVDFDDPAALARFGVAPSVLASEDREKTQAVASRVYASGATGLRWWSALSGDWHTVVLFLDRAPVEALEIDAPQVLSREHAAVVSACRFLAMRL